MWTMIIAVGIAVAVWLLFALFVDDGVFVGNFVFPIIIIIGFLVVLFQKDSANEHRLMEACMKDHKEYECVSMLRRNDATVVPLPVIIPGR